MDIIRIIQLPQNPISQIAHPGIYYHTMHDTFHLDEMKAASHVLDLTEKQLFKLISMGQFSEANEDG